MPEEANLPFHSFSFTLIEDRRPRLAFRMESITPDLYELHVEKGSAAKPSSQFTRSIPLESAQRFKDSLQSIGVFGWAESYGNVEGRSPRRWSVNTVFKEGVFSVASKGGSETPPGFDDMLEELYRLDFPRPAEQANRSGARGFGTALGTSGVRGFGALSAGDLGAYSSLGSAGGMDFSQMAELFGQGAFSGFDVSEMNELLSEAQRNPKLLQERMREEFRHLSPDEQNQMLDALAATGMASRAWWENFLRG